MIRLLIWRHGLTEWNSLGRFQGQTDTDLHPSGIEQAERVAPQLAAYHPDVIVSSDLRRAARTAAALATVTGLDVKFDSRLRERCFGPWQGLLAAEVAERYPEDYARWRRSEPVAEPGIEPAEELSKRATAAFRDAVDLVTAGSVGAPGGVGTADTPDTMVTAAGLAAAGTVVVVTHGGAARAGCAGLLGWSPATARALGSLDNCHFTELRHTDARGWLLYAHNLGGMPPDAQPERSR